MARYLQFLCLTALIASTALSAQPYAYTANSGNNTMGVLNLGNYSVVTTIPVGFTPAGVAVSPDGSTVYITSSYSNTISAIRTSDNTVLGTYNVGSDPTRLAVSPNGSWVYVPDHTSTLVSVFNTSSKTVSSINVGFWPSQVIFSSDSTRAYVANYYGSSISVIDTGAAAVIKTFSTGSLPSSLALTPDGQHIYVTNQAANSVTEYDTNGNLQATITGFNSPSSIAVAPNGKAFVTNSNSNNVAVINTASNSIIGTTAVGSLPTFVTITADGTQALVTNEYGWSVSVLDPSSYAVTHTIGNVGIYPLVIAVQPAQTGPVCNVSAALAQGSSLGFGSGGGTATINVTASANNCTWGVSNAGASFVTLTPSGTSGNGTVTVTAGANSSSQSLSGSITVAGTSFPVTEAGIACTYSSSINADLSNLPYTGGSASISITAPAGCAWSVSGPAWATLLPASGTGSGSVGVSVPQNASVTSRTGSISAPGGSSFTVTEAGAPCTYQVTGNSNLPNTAGNGTVTVTAPTGCTWNAISNDTSWLNVTSGTPGNGNGSVGYSYGANNSITGRSSSFTIAGQNFGVTQSATSFSPIFVNAGSSTPYIDGSGNTWAADAGHSYSVTMASITNTLDNLAIYNKAAYGSSLTYTYNNIPSGTFNVKLHFAETYEGGANMRLMTVTINGQQVASGLDVFAQAGAANTAWVVSYPVTVSAGSITVTISTSNGNPAMLSGLEIH